LILTDLHAVTSQETGRCITITVATPNLGWTECLQDGSYTDSLLRSECSQLNVEPRRSGFWNSNPEHSAWDGGEWCASPTGHFNP